MEEIVIASGLFLIVFAALFIAWYLIRNAKIKERLLLIEKGIDIKDLSEILSKKSHFPWLKTGIVLTGIAIGCIILAYFLISPLGQKFANMPGFSVGVIALFAGISLILANFIGTSKDPK